MISQWFAHLAHSISRVLNAKSPTASKSNASPPALREAAPAIPSLPIPAASAPAAATASAASSATPNAPIRWPSGSTSTSIPSMSSNARTTPAFLLTPPWNTTGATIFFPLPTLFR